MSGKDGGYRLPEEIDPQRIQFCIEIPNELNHIIAFWGALEELTKWWNWERDDAHTALPVTAVWDDVIKKARASFLNGDCESPVICQDYRNTSARLTWFPENPFHPNPEVPEPWLFHPWTVVDNSILGAIISQFGLGYQVGDVFTDITKIPQNPLSDEPLDFWTDMPHFRISGLNGSGTVKLHLLNIPQGGRALIVKDNEPLNILDYHAVELDKDSFSFPQEKQVPIIVEVEFPDVADHVLDVYLVPVIDDSFFPLFFGGGLRSFEICGFGREGCNSMDEECCDALIAGQSVTNDRLLKLVNLLEGGITGTFRFDGSLLPPDTGGGECAPDHFDHNGDDEDETALAQRAQALCATVQRYIKGVLLGALRDMGAPQFLIDYILAEIVTDIPLSLTNLTVSYPLSFSGLGVFFAIASAAFSFDALTCLMVAGLSGDKNNTSSNFKESIPEVTEGLDALLVPLAALLRATNQKTENYKAFNLALNDANDEDLSEFECPCEEEPVDNCEIPLNLVDEQDSTVLTHISGDIWRVQQSVQRDLDGWYYALFVDENLQCLDAEQTGDVLYPDWGATDSYTIIDCDGSLVPGTGGFLPLVNRRGIEFRKDAPIDGYVRVVCHTE